jgi:excisionase family DNA binding protein
MAPNEDESSQKHPALTMSLADAALLMGVSLKSIRKAARNGELPVIRWGASFRVVRAKLEALLQEETGSGK